MLGDLLFLVHRLPYPPNKGDKIRSYHILSHLKDRYRIHLGAFVDDPGDWQHIQQLYDSCASACIRPLNRRWARLYSLVGLATGSALTIPYYQDRKLRRWVNQLLRGNEIRYILVFSSAMAQYIPHYAHGGRRSIIDFVDVDSDKWKQYSVSKTWPLNWVYRREAKRLLQFERAAAARFDMNIFVSAAEANVFQRLAPEVSSRTTHLNNGVNTEFFTPHSSFSNPYGIDDRVLVFTGAMDYWANVDAVVWFANNVFPAIRRRLAKACFYIVGMRPVPEVVRLECIEGVVVTGSVPDIRPYLAHAWAAVVPLRIARGVQNKVLEAMAMAKPTVVSVQANEGIEAVDKQEVMIANNEQSFMEVILHLFENRTFAHGLGVHARQRICRDFSWKQNLARLDALLSGDLENFDSPDTGYLGSAFDSAS